MNKEKVLEILKGDHPKDDLLKYLLILSDEILESQMPLHEGSLKERVFEIILQRFETISFAKSFLNEVNLFSIPQILNASGEIYTFLNLTQKHIGHDFPEVGKIGLLGIFIKVYPTFLNDKTSDLCSLMSELDQILNSLKPFVNLFLLKL